MNLQDIIDKSELENIQLECKARLDRKNVEGWLKTAAGFANTAGGVFYIGVEDGSNKLIGFDRKAADSERNFFNNMLNEHLTPRPFCAISFLPYLNNNKELFVIRVRVEESEIKPVVMKYKGVPAIYMRRAGFTNGASYEEIIQLAVSSTRVQYDSLRSQEKYKRKDFDDLLAFYADHNDGEVLSDKALTSLGFFDKDGYLSNGAVLFRDDYEGGKTAVQCSVFSGFTKGSARIVSINHFNGNLTSAITYMMEYVRQRMNHSLIKTAEGRINIDAYPQRALFEGIVNAIAHRDYYLDGTQIEIGIFKDRLEITSPGGFYQREKIRKTYDLSSIISKRRNELICNVLVSCNVMEAAGTGFEKIMEEYRDVDQKHRPFISSESDHFTLVLPDLTYEDGVRDADVPELELISFVSNSRYDKDILEFCYNGERTARQISEYLNISDSTYFRNRILKNLEESGFLMSEVRNGTRYYCTDHDKAFRTIDID